MCSKKSIISSSKIFLFKSCLKLKVNYYIAINLKQTDVQQHDKFESLPVSFTASPAKICSQQQLTRKLSPTERQCPQMN